MVINHLNCGNLCPIGSLLITGHGGMFEPARLVTHCLLIESNDGLILVDTGLGIDDIEDPIGRLGRLPAMMLRIESDVTRTAYRQVQALGYDPKDVRHIVMTHLDFDHTGGLPDFPQAKVHVLDTEHEVAMNPHTLIERNRYSAVHFEHRPNWQLHEVIKKEKWFGFDNISVIQGLEPEILLIPLLGHSRGHCGVAIKTDTGWLLHAGDAFMNHNELDMVEPEAPFAIRMYEHMFKDDRDAMEANQALLRQLVHEEQGNVHVICSHDPDMMDPAWELPSLLAGPAYVA